MKLRLSLFWVFFFNQARLNKAELPLRWPKWIWEVFHKHSNIVCSQSCLFHFLMHGPRLPWDTCRAVLHPRRDGLPTRWLFQATWWECPCIQSQQMMVLKTEKLKQRRVVVLCRNVAWAKQEKRSTNLCVQPQGRVIESLLWRWWASLIQPLPQDHNFNRSQPCWRRQFAVLWSLYQAGLRLLLCSGDFEHLRWHRGEQWGECRAQMGSLCTPQRTDEPHLWRKPQHSMDISLGPCKAVFGVVAMWQA